MFTWLAQETRRAAGPPSNTAGYRLPWLGEQFGVFDRDVELQRVSLPGEAFDHVQSITVEIAVSVQPGLRIDGDDIHDERVRVPGRDGMTKRHWIEILTVLHANRNNSEGVGLIFITFIGALFPIVLNTVHGVANVDRRLVASARSLGAGGLAILREVVLPDAAPSIVTGLAIGMGTSWFCLVTAEMISGQFGIGYYTWEAYTLQNYADIIVGMLVIGLLGMGSSSLLTTAGRLLMPWRSPRVARRRW